MTARKVPFSDPDTSLGAAQALDVRGLERMERSVMAMLTLAAQREPGGGCTSHELMRSTGMRWPTVTARVRALALDGRVVDSGQRRPSPSGRPCKVWRLRADGDPPSPQLGTQTHGRIAAAVRQTWEAAAQWCDRAAKVARGAASTETDGETVAIHNRKADILEHAGLQMRKRRDTLALTLGDVASVELASRVGALIATMQQELRDIDADERYHYECANVVVNAPLALEQLAMETRAGHAKRVLRLLSVDCPELAIEPGPKGGRS